MQTKVLIIAYSFHPYSTVASFRMLRFAKYLPMYSIDPYILTAKHGRMGVKDPYPQTQYIRTPFSYRYDSPLNPLRFKDSKFSFKKGLNYLFRLIKDIFSSPDKNIYWSLWIIPYALKTIKKQNIQTVIVTGDPFSLFIAGTIIKKLTGVKLILDYRDPWLSNPVNQMQTFVRRYLNIVIQSITTKYSDLIMSPYRFVLEEVNIDESKTLLLPNGYDSELFAGITSSDSNDSQQKVFSFVYAGKIDVNTGYYNPAALLRGYRLFRAKNPSYKTKIVMFGSVSADTKSYLEKEGLLETVELAGIVTPREVIEAAGRSDALLHFISPLKTDNRMASKLYEYLKLEKPVISVNKRDSAISDLLDKTNGGFYCDNDNVEDIAGLFHKVYKLDKGDFRKNLNRDEIDKFDAARQTELLADKIKFLLAEPENKLADTGNSNI